MERDNVSLPRISAPHVIDIRTAASTSLLYRKRRQGYRSCSERIQPHKQAPPRNPGQYFRICRGAEDSRVDVRDREDDPRLPILEVNLDIIPSPMVLNFREKRSQGLCSRISGEESGGPFGRAVGLEIW